MDLSGPLLGKLQIRALPVGYDDPMCAHYPWLLDEGTAEWTGEREVSATTTIIIIVIWLTAGSTIISSQITIITT